MVWFSLTNLGWAFFGAQATRVDFAAVLERQEEIFAVVDEFHRVAIAIDQVMRLGSIRCGQLPTKNGGVLHRKVDGELPHNQPASALDHPLISMEIPQRSGCHRLGNWDERLAPKRQRQSEKN